MNQLLPCRRRAFAVAPPALAQEAATSPWSKGNMCLVAPDRGASTPSGKQRVGVEIVMAPGYKTYWRSPGDFGVPPRFDWSGSTNIGGLDVRWPAPERFQDGAGYSIGYVGEVVIPISVQPADPAKPVMLVLQLDYAVCEICIPVKGEASLWLEPGVTSVTSPRLESFEARVPVPVKPGPHREKPSMIEAKLDEGSAHPALRLVLQAPPEGRWTTFSSRARAIFGKSRLSQQEDGSIVALVRINERPKGVVGPLPFIFTLRGTPKSVETRLDLDIPAAKP